VSRPSYAELRAENQELRDRISRHVESPFMFDTVTREWRIHGPSPLHYWSQGESFQSLVVPILYPVLESKVPLAIRNAVARMSDLYDLTVEPEVIWQVTEPPDMRIA